MDMLIVLAAATSLYLLVFMVIDYVTYRKTLAPVNRLAISTRMTRQALGMWATTAIGLVVLHIR